MANQFDAKIRFDPVAWRAYDEESGAVATVIYAGAVGFKWVVYFNTSGPKHEGLSPTASSARAACRRRIDRQARLEAGRLAAPSCKQGRSARGGR